MMKPTIDDVARKANVSKATVSRVLNNKSNVSEAKREAVMQAIRTLQYQPNGMARNFADQPKPLIGLILPDLTNPFFPSLSRGVEDTAHYYNYTVVQCNTDNDAAIEETLLKEMQQQSLRGIILVSSHLNKNTKKLIEDSRIPIVLCDRLSSDLPCDSVSVDNYRAAFDAVTYLIELGHRRIIHISGPSKAPSAMDRQKGYVDAMEEHRLKPMIKKGTFTYEAGYELGRRLAEDRLPTAVFAGNDLLAAGVINALEESGIRTPGQVSVIGCDDSIIAKICRPRLTTIRQPAYQMGAKSFNLLFNRMENDTHSAEKRQQVILEHQFIVRESTQQTQRL